MDDCNRILLVEPEGIVQKAEIKFLQYWGAKVDIASNGSSALDKAQTSIYDFILVDAYLDNGFDGFELVHAIRHHSLNKKTQCAILYYDDEAFENRTKADPLEVWYIERPILLNDAKNILDLAKELSIDNKPK